MVLSFCFQHLASVTVASMATINKTEPRCLTRRFTNVLQRFNLRVTAALGQIQNLKLAHLSQEASHPEKNLHPATTCKPRSSESPLHPPATYQRRWSKRLPTATSSISHRAGASCGSSHFFWQRWPPEQSYRSRRTF